MKRILVVIFCPAMLIVIAGRANAQLWKEYEDSAKVFQNGKNISKTIEYLTKANAELERDSAVSASNAQILKDIGLLFYNSRQLSKAEPYWIKSKEIQVKIFGSQNLLYAGICSNLGILYLETGKYEMSALHLLEAKQLIEKIVGKESAEYALACNNLGNLYKTTGEYARAELLFIESKDVRAKAIGKETSLYAQSCGNLAILYKLMGAYDKAEPLYKESKNIFEMTSGKNSLDYAQSTNNLGVFYFDIGNYRDAENLYNEAKGIRQKLAGPNSQAHYSSCNNLGILYTRMNRYEEAEALFLEAKSIVEKTFGNKHQEYATNCNNLGLFYSNIGQSAKAEALLLEAKDIWSMAFGTESPLYALCCFNLGNLYEHSNPGKAEAYHSEAKQIREKILGPDHPDYAQSCNGLARLYSENRQFDKAEPLFFEARRIMALSTGRNNPQYAANCDYIGNMLRETGQFTKAEKFYLEAIEIWKSIMGEKSKNYAASKRNLANLYRLNGEFEKAQLAFSEIFQIENEYVDQVFNFTSEPEKLAYLDKNAGTTSQYFSFIKASGYKNPSGLDYTVSLNNRNRVLDAFTQQRQLVEKSSDTILKSRFEEWIQTKEQLAYWLSKPLKERAGYDITLRNKTQELEKQLSKLSKTFKQIGDQKISFESVRSNLKNSEAAIEFASFQYSDGNRWTDSIYYIALVLRKDKPEPELVYLFEERELNAILKQKRAKPEATIDDLYTSTALYNLIWKPLDKHFENISKVYFASSGLLHKLNLSAIAVNKNQTLGDLYSLVQLNTTASVGEIPNTVLTTPDKILLYGGVKFNADTTAIKSAVKLYQLADEKTVAYRGFNMPADQLTELPFSEMEVDNIAQIAKKGNYSAYTFKGVDANEESVKSLKGKQSPTVLHFATHGKFFPDPVKVNPEESLSGGKVYAQSDNPLFRSMLLLAGANNAWSGKPASGIQDGVLTAYEISNMYLPNTKLVVLSACETGLGDIQGSEGVYG
jgi:tetratricopeptide (TPR) repeat protein